MEALNKKEIIFVKNKNAKETFEMFPCEEKNAIIDFTSSLVVFPNSKIIYKRFKKEDYKKAWEQLKRWISAGSFEQVLILGGFDCLPSSLIFEWLNDHKSKEGFPKLVISGENIDENLTILANQII